jgi:hypothetical protein
MSGLKRQRSAGYIGWLPYATAYRKSHHSVFASGEKRPLDCGDEAVLGDDIVGPPFANEAFMVAGTYQNRSGQ